MNSFIAAFDKKTGREVWRVPRKVDVTWSTPVLVQTDKRTELVHLPDDRQGIADVPRREERKDGI